MENLEKTEANDYIVVVNHEEQYSIWQSWKEIPLGWKQVGDPNTREACLSYIKQVWTDMRPLSLRKKMEEQVEGQAKTA